MQPAQIYTAVTVRLLDLAPRLTPEQRAIVPAPTPDWTVVDTYRHLVGATADTLRGRVEGRGSPEWTDAQLKARATLRLHEICAEWSGLLPPMAALLAADPGQFRLELGYWTHEQDIRAAVGLPVLREDPHLIAMTAALLSSRVEPYEQAGVPALRLVATDAPVDVVLGAGGPELTLRAEAFELLRTVTSRRSLRQCLAAQWAGGDDAVRTAVLEALALFPLPTEDVREA